MHALPLVCNRTCVIAVRAALLASYAQSAERNEVGSRVVAVLRAKQYADAWRLAKEYADLTKKEVGETHRDYGFALLLQAEIAYHLGGADGEKAEPLYEQAVQVFENLRASNLGEPCHGAGTPERLLPFC